MNQIYLKKVTVNHQPVYVTHTKQSFFVPVTKKGHNKFHCMCDFHITALKTVL